MLMLRQASREDLTRVTSWLRSQEECELWAGWRVQFPIDIEVLPSAIEFTEKNSYVWGSEEKLIAFGQIVEKPDDRRHLARIIVNPLVRRRGHGEAFVRELLKNASSTRVSLNVAKRNSSAVALYRKLGFAEAVRPPDESASANSHYMEYSARATTSR